jgi:hypothetical protein|tara:strand:- start:80 stop:343 length:264 start_codon:yes stop_codon:yes gene_type:complete
VERYVAIRLRGADIDKGFYLRVTNETDRFLSGIEVNDKADEVMPRGKCTERLRVIDQSEIRIQYAVKLSNHYGTFEPVEYITPDCGL